MGSHTMMERIAVLREAGQLKRLHALPTLRVHTLAEHVYGAQVLAAELCWLNSLDGESTGKVLAALLVHDAPEVWTGDVPAQVKRGYAGAPDGACKAIDDALSALEIEWCTSFSITMPMLSRREHKIVKAADGLDLAFALLGERTFGNRHWRIEDVFERVLGYVIELKDEVQGVSNIVAMLREEWNND